MRHRAIHHLCRIRSLALAAIASGCGDNGTGPSGGVLRFVAGTQDTDTVLARPIQALVVEVRDPAGPVATGAVVRFQGLRSDTTRPFELTMLVGSLSSTFFSGFATDTVDSRGRASVLIQFGTVAGRGRIEVSVPEFGVVDTADYTVLPGQPTDVSAFPRDTALYVGAIFQARGAVVDRWGNPRSDPVTYSGATPAISVTAGGRVTAGAVGRAHYVVRGGGLTDTGWVSVVPLGTLAAVWTDPTFGRPPQLVVTNLDGSGFRMLTPTDGGGALSWTPDGSKVVFGGAVNGTIRLETMDLAGTVARLIVTPPSTLVTEAWPQYSPDGNFVFFSGIATGAYNFSLWQVASDGSGASQLYSDPSGIAWRCSASPDGTRLAFVNASSSPSGIQVYTLAAQSVSSWSVVGQTPRWSPRGEQIAFVQPYGGALYVMDSNGQNVRQVSPAQRSYEEGSLGWSPDGAWLVARGPQGLELINVSSGLTLPLGFASTLLVPAWKP
jgi:hypothetical protein